MRKAILLTAGLSLVLLGLVYVCSLKESRDSANYQKIRVGMSVEEVEAILGPRTEVKQEDLPSNVVAMNPQDAVDSLERARKSGATPPTARDYPTQHKPVVEGDYILQWKNSETWERILVAFKDGKVCEKHHFDPNYL